MNYKQELQVLDDFNRLLDQQSHGDLSWILFYSYSGTPPFEIKWLKDRKEVCDTDCYRYVVYEDGGVALRLANVNSLDAGEYTCLVRNAFGSSSCNGLFAVQGTSKNLNQLHV